MPTQTQDDQRLSAELSALRDRIFAGDNGACLVERERLLAKLSGQAQAVPPQRRYAWAFEKLLAGVSTPIEPGDVFLGRVVEARWEGCTNFRDVNRSLLPTRGHLTLHWPDLLEHGLGGLARQAQHTAQRMGSDSARQFADSVGLCRRAVAEFSARYAADARSRAAELPGHEGQYLRRAARALEGVPDGPATDLFSALQSIWLIHLITSCYVGARDFGLGRLDRHLLPYYRKDLREGRLDRQQARELLAHFLLKTNEITGTATWNHNAKPIPCQSSKQYLLLGGRGPNGEDLSNELTELILSAAQEVGMPQPVLTVCLDPDSPEEFQETLAQAATVLGSQIHFYHDRAVQANLRSVGLSADLAAEYSMGGCCRAEIGGVTTFIQSHYSLPHWLMGALSGGRPAFEDGPFWTQAACPPDLPAPEQMHSIEDVLSAFARVCQGQLRHKVVAKQAWLEQIARDRPFHFESLLLRDCIARGQDCESGGSRCALLGQYFNGIATVADSLWAIQRLVFEQNRLTLTELMDLCRADFAGWPELRNEIVRLEKFGNQHEGVDALAARAATAVLDAMEAIAPPQDDQHIISGFYSLHKHHFIGRELHATPDGRLAGEPVSENQSPVYGMDRSGLTALLQSVARLPLERTCEGGLNVAFAGQMQARKLRDLIATYFRLGGLHVGFTFVDSQTLQAAREHPDQYRTLTVRLYGFSEYFVALSDHEQRELIQRTRHGL
jgi:formate C-acetyltransferase